MRSVGRNVEEHGGGEGALFTGVPGVGPPHRPSNKRKRGRTREERQETTETSWRRRELHISLTVPSEESFIFISK